MTNTVEQAPHFLTIVVRVVVGCVLVINGEAVDGGVNGFLELIVGTFGVKIHGPGKVHEGQVCLTQLFVHLREAPRVLFSTLCVCVCVCVHMCVCVCVCIWCHTNLAFLSNYPNHKN